ncbi:HAD family phosphatase [Dyella sp.]|uniref:HAD family hydrolase n=1 Tax=Dyella sp. TaxID=1869338 RepID=UPI002ED45C93
MNHSVNIDTVVFDLGGVLIDWNPRYLYRQLFDDEQAMEHFLAHICNGEWNEQQDAGRPWHEAVATLSARHPEHAERIAAYWHRWEETLGDAIEETVRLLAALKRRGVRLYALTNWSGETFPVARRRFAFLAWFEGIVVSGDERLIKPDPQIFQRLLSRYAIDPARALYIDDAQRNVQAAAALGMQACWFRDATALRDRLLALNLLTAEEVDHG